MIIDLQRRIAEAGRIRIGQQVPTGKGKSRPAKLETFRLTSPDRRRIEQAAGLYGGRPREWQAPAGKQWEVVTESDSLDVIVPPTDMAFSQHYELWAAGGCQRRCDGQREQIGDGDCLCDPEQRECSIHTRLSVMLRDLTGLGVWRIDTQGYYAAVELQAAVGVIQMAAGRGQMLPARLRLEQRVVKRPDVGTRRFAVPVLDIEISPGQLLGGGTVGVGQLDSPQAVAIEASGPQPTLTPVPAELPTGPQRSVAEQAKAVEQAQPKPKRRGAAPPVTPTGKKPRTAAQAQTDTEPGWTRRIREDEPPPEPEPPTESTPINDAQVQKVAITCREAALDDQGRHDLVLLATDGRSFSSKDLTKSEMDQVLTVAELIQAGRLNLRSDGPGGDPVLMDADGAAKALPLDLAKANAWLDKHWRNTEEAS